MPVIMPMMGGVGGEAFIFAISPGILQTRHIAAPSPNVTRLSKPKGGLFFFASSSATLDPREVSVKYSFM